MRRQFLRRYATCILAILVTVISGWSVSERAQADAVLSARPKVVAQLGLGNLLGTGKDFAVKAALSAFGKSLGDQLPIVVPAGDAYPTTPTLPGLPFAPGTTPEISSTLRASSDGTIVLPPGDYAFPVDVYCMRVHSHSPSSHRYLVAPLHGSAADIITALNSRSASYGVDHHVLQVLSWDIQAGMAYGVMQANQRAAVDRIIPDYRTRLNGDLYERIRDEYAQTAQNVPGMPSFEGALSRIGPVGAQVVALQSLRQELTQPSPTFDDLARALVPELPTGSASDVGGATPWSRYSDRVYMRFVTEGNYATPGTYQVRVLPAVVSTSYRAIRTTKTRESGLVRTRYVNSPSKRSSQWTRLDATQIAAASNGASVPFTNIVNNPGTDAVQPLTQSPNGAPSAHHLPSGPSRLPTPRSPGKRPTKKHPKDTIISQTVATIPGNRDRTLVGVGEEVYLTFTGGDALWNVRGSDGSVESESGATAMYSAASVAAVETITARGKKSTASITFQVIPPSGVITRRVPNTPTLHHNGRPDSGLLMYTYLTPDNVSFQFVDFIERNVGAVGTGVFAAFNGIGHGPNPVPLPVGAVVPGLGSQLMGIDTGYSGDTCVAAPFEPSFLVFNIPDEYILWRGSDFHPIATVVQASSVRADGVSLETEKVGGFVTLDVGDATTAPKAGCTQLLPASPRH